LKALVVTADDVGLHTGMTAGALKAHDEGIVTAVSVSANGRAFEEAVDLLKDRPGLDVGIHLTLVGERPISRPERVRTLMDGRNGTLLPDFRMFTRRYLLAGIAPGEVEEELRRQVERLAGTGLPIVHINSHQHLHVLPKIFETVLRIAEEHRIPYVRIPNEPAVRRPSPRALQIGILNGIGKTARRRLEDHGGAVRGIRGIRAMDQTVGVLDAGSLNSLKLTQILGDVEGLAELVCHPGLGAEALAAAYDWGYGWERETAALCDAGVRETLRGKGIELTSFRQATIASDRSDHVRSV
jgi:chitin disaccharide deacetylase